jgi:predicted Zn-dependent peptidase
MIGGIAVSISNIYQLIASRLRYEIGSLLLASFCLLSLSIFGAPTYADQPVFERPQIVKKTLENGLTLIVKPERGSGLVAIVAAVRVGAEQESFQIAGIGNFVAQLLLASTRLSSAEEVAAVADEVGGNIGVQWHPDFTEIRAVTTSAMFNKAMDLIGEALTEANFESKWVEQVRADLLRRVKEQESNPFEKAYDELRTLLYKDSGYKRRAIGSERTIRLATPEDLMKFYRTYYVPNNIVISIVGDVTVEQAIDRVEKAFAGVLPGRLPTNRGMPDETLERSTYRASEVDLRVAYLMIGWLAPSMTSPDYAAVAVAANALGAGKGSMMFRELRQKRGMGYDLGTIYPRFKHQSHVVAYVITDPYKLVLPNLRGTPMLEEVKNALLEQVEELKKRPLSDKELQRAKGYTIGVHALSQQHLIDRAFQLAWLEAIGVGYEMYQSFITNVEKVTAEDVQRVARKYFTNYAAIVLIPKSQSAAFETSSVDHRGKDQAMDTAHIKE